MVEELSGGKMMYAFLRVKDPNTSLFKNVLVNWVSFCPHVQWTPGQKDIVQLSNLSGG